jgi:hypothetical protein
MRARDGGDPERKAEAFAATRADVPPELQQIVDGCLAKDPEDRWETARDVARQIDAIAPSHTTTPLPNFVGDHYGSIARNRGGSRPP